MEGDLLANDVLHHRQARCCGPDERKFLPPAEDGTAGRSHAERVPSRSRSPLIIRDWTITWGMKQPVRHLYKLRSLTLTVALQQNLPPPTHRIFTLLLRRNSLFRKVRVKMTAGYNTVNVASEGKIHSRCFKRSLQHWFVIHSYSGRSSLQLCKLWLFLFHDPLSHARLSNN